MTFWPLISRPFWIGHYHKQIGLIYLLISIIPENLTSIGQSVLEILSKIAKFELLTSDKSAILDRPFSQNNRGDLLMGFHHSWKFDRAFLSYRANKNRHPSTHTLYCLCCRIMDPDTCIWQQINRNDNCQHGIYFPNTIYYATLIHVKHMCIWSVTIDIII